jgi:hypothetical protein
MEDHNKQIITFLCHTSDDKPKVRELYQQLRKDGFNPWLDEENLLPGHDWQLEIQKAVRESDIIIVCLSKVSINKTGYVQKEIKYALDIADEQPEGTVFIIPLKLEECNVPERLRKWQWVNLFTDNGYQRLILSLNTRIAKTEKSQIEDLNPSPTSPANIKPRDTKISIGINSIPNKGANYTVMFPLTFLGCLFGLVLTWSFMDTSNFSFMLCVFPPIVLVVASLGWVFGGLISQSTLNPFINLYSSRLTLGLIGSVFGFSIGLYLLRSTCEVARPGYPAYEACHYYSVGPVIETFALCVLPPTIVGLVIGVTIAYIAKQKKKY